jgi:glutathione S-transferase
MSGIKLTYFNIQGAAEKVRLALVLKGVEFEDERVSFDQWSELKPKTKFGQLPMMTIGETEVAQSDAMLRYVASLPGDCKVSRVERNVCVCNIPLSFFLFILISYYLTVFLS